MNATAPLTSSKLPEAESAVDRAPGSSSQTCDIVVVGTSSGGVSALKRLVAAMPADYSGAVFIVLHIGAGVRSELAAILGRSGSLPVVTAEDGMPIEGGRIYTAMADHHLLLERGHVRVVRGPRENRHRPAIDPLFRSAAWAYGPRVIGVVLTGNLDDGTAGLWAVKSCGGTTVVQEPSDAEFPEMPTNALLYNEVDHRLPLADIPDLLLRLSRRPARTDDDPAKPVALREEVHFAALERDIEDMRRFGTPSVFTCPSCRGALWELEEAGHLRYRCHTGHAFSQESLQVGQDVAVEEHLYAALRALEEKAAMLRRLAERWPQHLPGVRDGYLVRAKEVDRSASVLRTMLAGGTV